MLLPAVVDDVLLYARTNSSYDPSTDIHNPLRYTPSNVLTSIALAAFAIVFVLMTWLSWRGGRWRASYMRAMVVGCFFMAFGFAWRYPLRTHPDSKGVYIIEDLAIVLSPCAFIATNYAIMGRLARSTGTGRYVIIKSSILTKVFVSSDVATFLIQAFGGTLSISTKKNTVKLGSDLFKIGIILQFVSYAFFTLVCLIWAVRVRRNEPQIWNAARSVTPDGKPVSHEGGYRLLKDWRILGLALAWSCAGILIRSAYRTAEGVEGLHGSLATNETTFYALDTLPLFLAVVVYIIVWPGNFIDLNAPEGGQYAHHVGLAGGASLEGLDKPAERA